MNIDAPPSTNRGRSEGGVLNATLSFTLLKIVFMIFTNI